MFLQVSRQVCHRYPVDPRCASVALYSLQRCVQVLLFPHPLPQLYVGLSFVSHWGRLGSLLSSRKLHFLLLLSSSLIQGRLPSVFIPQTAQSTRPFLMFDPSLRDGSGTLASADPCCLSLVSQPGLPFPARQQVSPGKFIDFPRILAGFTALAFDCLGLRCFVPTHPTSRPLIRFVFLKSQVCLRLPPDPISR